MISYLRKRKCPNCFCDFVIVLVDRSSHIQSVNGFCGNCDYCINWQLIQKGSRARANAAQNKFPYKRIRL
jgi:hypothetical protein